jgi:predicted nucleotidyltransferase
MRGIRLSEEEIEKIKDIVKEVFGDDIEIYIFGSRARLDKKGGDIDILIKTNKEVSTNEKLTFLARLELKGIERKVDLLVISPKTKFKDIHREALDTGVKIL